MGPAPRLRSSPTEMETPWQQRVSSPPDGSIRLSLYAKSPKKRKRLCLAKRVLCEFNRKSCQADGGNGGARGCAGWLIAVDRSGRSRVAVDVQVAADDPLRGTLSMLPGPLGSSSSHRRCFSLQLTASSKAWLRLLRLAGGAADPWSPTSSLVAKHWDPTDLNIFSSRFRLN